MELLFDNATFQIYILHTPGHFQVILKFFLFTVARIISHNLKQFLILHQGSRWGSLGQIHAVVWRIPLETSYLFFIVLRRSTVGLTLYFTRERTARWVQRWSCEIGIHPILVWCKEQNKRAPVILLARLLSCKSAEVYCPTKAGAVKLWNVIKVYMLSQQMC